MSFLRGVFLGLGKVGMVDRFIFQLLPHLLCVLPKSSGCQEKGSPGECHFRDLLLAENPSPVCRTTFFSQTQIQAKPPRPLLWSDKVIVQITVTALIDLY